MLARLLPLPALFERRPEPRGPAVVLPFSRPRPAAPKADDWREKYPCTRMHGAAFEAEFHRATDDQP